MTPGLLLAFSLAAQAAAPAQQAQATPSPPAAPLPLTEWPFRFVDDDYPAAALRNDEQGHVRYRLEIGGDGRVSRCTITSSSGSSTLDATTCRIVSRRARFTPARDSGGHAVTDTREGEVTWRLPQDD
jgi:protein TonB